MKNLILFIPMVLCIIASCSKPKEEVFYKANVFIVSTSVNNCGLNLAIDTNFDDGSDIQYHASNLPDTAELGDVYYIQYEPKGGVFDCEIQGSVVGARDRNFKVIEITKFK